MTGSPDINSLRDLLRSASREHLLPRFSRVERHLKSDGSIVTEADHVMQASVVDALSQHWPDIPLLGEEMTPGQREDLLRSSNGRVWILDPLDGTSNFAAGIPYFCVSLALVEHDRVSLGMVYDPVRDEFFSAQAGQGAYLNDQQLDLAKCDFPALKGCIAAVDFKRLESVLASRLAVHPPFASQRSFGSGALDWCWLAAGRFHVYLHGRQQVWDYAAGQRILNEAGGFETTLEGVAASLADMRPRSAVVAGNASLMQAWCDYLGVMRAE